MKFKTMKASLLFVMGLFLVGITSCKKDNTIEPQPVKEILLKDVIQKNLPSPYYHFDYDAGGKIIMAGFASNQNLYDVIYNGSLIKEMRNTSHTNKDIIQYAYDGQKRVEFVKVVNAAGNIYRFAELTYDATGRLKELTWEVRLDGVGFAVEQTLKFSYDGNSNLVERRDQRHFIENRQPAALYIDRFEQYDNRVNVDGFELLHQHDRHLLILPGIQLQHNNPLKNIRTGDGVNYEITYSYVYDNNRPVQKNGDMLITNGENAGQHSQVGSTFSYYND